MRFHAEVKREQDRRAGYRIRGYYPETGAYRRDLYPRHLEIMALGAKYRERCFLAGNQCITPWTPIETGRATRLSGELLDGRAFDVQSWDGVSRCTTPARPVFLRGIEPAFRLYLGNGGWLDCSRKHQVLTHEGWLSVGQLIRLSSGIRWWGTSEGSPASYAPGGCLGDGPLHRLSGSVQVLLHAVGDALPLVQQGMLGDAAVRICQCSHAFQALGLIATEDVLALLADLCGQFADPTAALDARWSPDERRARWRFARASTQLPTALRSTRDRDACDVVDLWESGCLADDRTPRPRGTTGQGVARYHEAFHLADGQREFLEAPAHSVMFSPSSHPLLVGGDSIVAVVPLGCQPIIDFQVPRTHAYVTSGVVSHNCGKTEGVGAYELTCHMTGNYPTWWTGRRYDRPVTTWAAGDTSKTVRGIIQTKLLGPPGQEGTGMLPAHTILHKTAKGGVSGAVDMIWVRHASGGHSTLELKSYDQRREGFQGTVIDMIWLDEEPPYDVYVECLLRTATNNGMILATFTPLMGITPLIVEYLSAKDDPESPKAIVQAGWDDVPHLTPEAKKQLMASIPVHQRNARTKGVPELGAGSIYPIPREDFEVSDFEVPPHWRHGYGMDVGWRWTAAAFGAWNLDTDTLYIWSAYKRGQAEPAVHAGAIKARGGTWMAGVIDPAAQQRSQDDGRRLLTLYREEGLNLHVADHAVESGIFQVYNRLSTGRMKVFKSCAEWFAEHALYRRAPNGHVVKENDHLMDGTRYLELSGLAYAVAKPVNEPKKNEPEFLPYVASEQSLSWMG